MCEQVMMFKKF